MVKKLLENKILILNIIVSLIVLFLIILSQKHTCLIRHGYSYPWGFDFNLYYSQFVRFPSFCFEYLFNNFLPNFFNTNPNDFRSGVGLGCILLSLLYFFICFLFSEAFFVNLEEEKSMLKRKEFIYIFPLSFFFLSLPLSNLGCDFIYYIRLEDLSSSAEYFFNYIPLFMYFYFFFYCVKNKENIKFKKIHLFILIIFSFMTGAYNEITNLTAFFSSVIMLFLLFFFDKERLYNKNILYPLISLFLGIIHYYVICNNFTDVANRIYELTLFDTIINSLSVIDVFLLKFYQVIIKSKIIYLVIILMLSFWVFSKRDKKLNLSIYFVFSIILGYFLLSFTTLFVYGIPGYDGFLFERDIQDCVYVNLLEFLILILLGTIYASVEKKNIISVILLLILTIGGALLKIHSDDINDVKFEIKQITYNVNKYNVIYSVLGETTIFPKSLIDINIQNFNFQSLGYLPVNVVVKHYYSGTSFHYSMYFSKVYNIPLIGAIFVDDEVAERELNKRLELLDETKEDMNLPRGKYISFNNLYKKYKGKKFTSDELLKIEERKGKSPILTKAIAYAYYQEKEYDKSIELYKEYLKEVPNDFDANLNIGEMYTETKNYKKALEYLYKLNSVDEKILNILFKQLNIYMYEKKDKEKAIETCDRMISINNKMHSLYLNKAIVYFHFEDKESAEKVLIESRKVDEKMADIWMKMLKSYRFAEQKLIEPPLRNFLQ